eukprot:TRINITY_DN25396_c0_g1_i2.p2 TRINITY_DN25396_c0_g1~~TRINITY_DN25396_c0_g1_i2.p2  ORF type:complete len:110 (+),score=28.66 TRINITY_DN25396_c0_g1_i2:490-819(+)
MLPVPKAAAKKLKKGSVEEAKAAWSASLKGGTMYKIITDHMPAEAICHMNDAQGLFRISILGKGPKSFSWTLRGHEMTIKCVLHWLWSARQEMLGGEIPSHLDFSGVFY